MIIIYLPDEIIHFNGLIFLDNNNGYTIQEKHESIT